jgi:hypothetical protein
MMMAGPRIPPGGYTREMVISKVKQYFPNENHNEILAILDLYGGGPEKYRVHIAVLKLSIGNIEKLRENVAEARFDFRNVIGAAEYEEDWLMRDPTLPDLNKPEQ